jgi:hypothetical protein
MIRKPWLCQAQAVLPCPLRQTPRLEGISSLEVSNPPLTSFGEEFLDGGVD